MNKLKEGRKIGKKLKYREEEHTKHASLSSSIRPRQTPATDREFRSLTLIAPVLFVVENGTERDFLNAPPRFTSFEFPFELLGSFLCRLLS